jgi:hypothetical protein
MKVKCTIGAVEGDQKHGSQVTEVPNIKMKLHFLDSSCRTISYNKEKPDTINE